jgi:hypothetical protein
VPCRRQALEDAYLGLAKFWCVACLLRGGTGGVLCCSSLAPGWSGRSVLYPIIECYTGKSRLVASLGRFRSQLLLGVQVGRDLDEGLPVWSDARLSCLECRSL